MTEFMKADTTPGPQMVPHSKEAEEAVVGGCLINPEAIDLLPLQAEDFYIHRNGWVWDAMLTLTREKKPVDYVTVVELLDERGQLADIGGTAYITKLLNSVPSSLHVKAYADTVLSTAIRRETIQYANSLVKEAYNEAGDIIDGRARIAGQLLAVRSAGGAKPISNLLSRGWDLMERVQDSPAILAPLSTGLPDLDEVMGGGLYPGMTFLLGETGLGKSILAQQIASNLASNNVPVAFYAGEMHWQDMYLRLMGDWAGLKTRDLRAGKIDWNKLTEATDLYSDMPMFFDDPKNMTTAELRADLTKLVVQHGLKAMVFDFLDDLKDEEGNLKDWERSALLATRVQDICVDLNIRGLVVHEVTKEGQQNPNKAGIAGHRKVAYRAISAFQILPYIKQGEMTRDDYNLRTIKCIKENRLAPGNRPYCDLRKDPEYPRFQSVAKLEE